MEIDPKDKRQFKRAVATLNKILEMYSYSLPEAHFHIEGDDLQLLSEPHNPRHKRPKNILCRAPLVGKDG
ncbi:MAG: hypothetical protein CFH43_00315 [Proteobacteria bacterium]|nr:MAG: hypothetical protein CFH43_00315 [Pseudomonadota bacterium]|tara:strand:+ start:341 stop:550 length:210 start_codon:yes stop_codon:yes gene_type:complete